MAKDSDIYGSIPTKAAEELFGTFPGSSGHTIDINGAKDSRVPPMDNEKNVKGE